MGESDQARTEDSGLVNELRSRYLEALIRGDRPSAAAVVDEGLARGLTPPTLLLEVLAPTQIEIGQLWYEGEVSISQEHWATRVTEEQIERALESGPSVASLEFSAVVTTAPGEAHTIPARCMAGLLRWRGWSVDYLGSGPPTVDLIEFVRLREPHLVALSVTIAAHASSCIELCQQLRRLESAPAILAGGAGVAGLEAAHLGADATTGDLGEGLDLAAQLVGIGSARSLESYLAVVGRRIRQCRYDRGLSQTDLAKRSELSRPYLSALEAGRQNITLEVALRIAGALGMSVSRLLEEKPGDNTRNPKRART